MSSYSDSKMMVGKWILIAFLTLLPPFMMASSGQDAAIVHSIETGLDASKQKGALEPGDITWVSGVIQATPLDLPDRLSTFRNSLLVRERIEEYRRRRKTHYWATTRLNEWIVDKA